MIRWYPARCEELSLQREKWEIGLDLLQKPLPFHMAGAFV